MGGCIRAAGVERGAPFGAQPDRRLACCNTGRGYLAAGSARARSVNPSSLTSATPLPHGVSPTCSVVANVRELLHQMDHGPDRAVASALLEAMFDFRDGLVSAAPCLPALVRSVSAVRCM